VNCVQTVISVTEAHFVDILDAKDLQDALHSFRRVQCKFFRGEKMFQLAVCADYESVVSIIKT
jgi:hypothetical protein